MSAHNAWFQSLATVLIAGLTFQAGYALGTHRFFGQRKKYRKAFVLVVEITFKSTEDLESFLELWMPFAEYVARNEPGTLAYEAARADTKPNTILIFERYVDKNAFLEVHTNSVKYKELEGACAAKNIGIVSKTGQSYIEEDIGYM
eukprot:jgi/Botrbrau1/20630/Bobra.113_1s0055.1